MINTLMLSTRGPGPMLNPPGMVAEKLDNTTYSVCGQLALRAIMLRSRPIR